MYKNNELYYYLCYKKSSAIDKRNITDYIYAKTASSALSKFHGDYSINLNEEVIVPFKINFINPCTVELIMTKRKDHDYGIYYCLINENNMWKDFEKLMYNNNINAIFSHNKYEKKYLEDVVKINELNMKVV